MTTPTSTPLTVDFCGELHQPNAGRLTIGRDADVVLDDDNPFLHRQFLLIAEQQGLWWLTNVGSQLTATVSDGEGGLQAWLSPGGSLPLVFPKTVVWFTAGPTTYEFEILLDQASYERVTADDDPGDDDPLSRTIGRVSLTPEQKLLIIALCEDVLRRGDRGAGLVPQSAVAAKRLGWALTKFNRKLDNVCGKLADLGVRGLHGGITRSASSRKARLVEYAMAARIVTVDDLDLLPPIQR